MTKKEFVDKISEKSGLSKTDCDLFLNGLSDVLLEVIATEDSVRLGKVGVISGFTRPARTGRNPKSGETIEIPAKSGYPRMRFSSSAKA